jgi:broad specificity phosphatase PhoE/ribonuclease HI
VTSRVIIEADGGSRGNPGPASYGALVRDADTGAVIAQRGETIGRATNNVAEYSGLIAGLELYAEHTPGASLEVRMDSKLVIEQMAGRWKIKHPDMVPLAARARRLVPAGTTWTWVPRERNKAADALANAALDSQRDGGSGLVSSATAVPTAGEVAATAPAATGWGGAKAGEATTLVLLRHGVTSSTERKAFSGSGGTDPELTETGREQARRAAQWLQAHGGIDAIVASPMRRTRETAAAAGELLGLDVTIDEGFVETSFGDWDGFTFAEIQQRWGDELTAWLGSTAVAPPGGETFDAVGERVTAARDRLMAAYPGQTVLVVTHVTPIKLLVRLALEAPMSVIYKMELSPASITTVQWWPDGPGSVRNVNVVP